MAKKLTTAEILALARAKKDGAAPNAPAENAATPQAAEPASEEAATAPKPAAAKPASPKPAAGKPSSTADILAAARAQKAAAAEGEAAPASAKPAAAGAKPAAAGKPKSTAEILAAARAKKSSAEAGAAPAAGSATKASGSKAAAAVPEGGLPSVQEMVRAVREGKQVPAAEEGAAKKPALPPRPQKPAAPAAKAGKPTKEEPVSRRGVLAGLVLSPFAAAWTMLGVASGAATLGLARFMMPNVLVEPPSRFKIGPKEDYPFGTVSTKWKAEFGIAIVHTNYGGQNVLYALSTVCTHLGCTPNWLDGEQKFKCPCHGSGFYMNGINFEGPAPRPLERVGLALAPDGNLEVDKSLKFQEEMGQWSDASSYVMG